MAARGISALCSVKVYLQSEYQIKGIQPRAKARGFLQALFLKNVPHKISDFNFVKKISYF